MYISLNDLLLGLLGFTAFCIFIVVSIYLIMTLYHLNTLFKRVNKVLDENRVNINQTLVTLPDAVNNLNEVAISIKDNVDKAGIVIDTLEEVVTETALTVSESTESVYDVVKVAGNVANVVSALITAYQNKE